MVRVSVVYFFAGITILQSVVFNPNKTIELNLKQNI